MEHEKASKYLGRVSYKIIVKIENYICPIFK
jgi:hypothetical protein